MAKLNRKAVEANLRNKLSVQYKQKVMQLQAQKAVLEKSFNDMWHRARQAEIERDELKEKVAVYEDWNRRLQEFMDMNENDRQQYIENLRKSKELDQLIKKFGFYSDLFSRLFV